MKHRFRYLNEQGQQVEVADLSTLREHARQGRLDDDTLLYDGLTDEWAPASAHSAYRLLDEPMSRAEEEGVSEPPAKEGVDGAVGEASAGAAGEEGGGTEGARTDPADAPPTSDTGLDLPDLEVTLAPDEEVESTDEVVEKLLRERKREGRGTALPEVTRGYKPRREPEPPPGEATPDPWSGARRAPKGPERPDPDDEPIRAHRRSDKRPDAPKTRPARPTRKSSGARGGDRDSRYEIEIPRSVVLLGGLLMVAGALYGLTRVLDPSESAQASTGEPESANGVVRTATSSPWAAAEGGAFRDMLEGADSLREVYSVERMPRMWLAGPYLADADRFPEVREYWQDYGRFVAALRSQDTALFRRSFVDRLEEQGVSGAMVSIRLARALDTFGESQPARDTVYERMEDLATSALDLHELLVDRTDDLVYDPVTEDRASRQPILEAWSDDAFLRRSIWSLLDRITANLALLEYDAGSGRSDLTERLFQELRTRSGGEEGAEGSG